MYIVIVWTGGRKEGSPDVFGPYLSEDIALDAAEQAQQAWGWQCLVTELRPAGELQALPPFRVLPPKHPYQDGRRQFGGQQK